jgi:hypothetical protein
VRVVSVCVVLCESQKKKDDIIVLCDTYDFLELSTGTCCSCLLVSNHAMFPSRSNTSAPCFENAYMFWELYSPATCCRTGELVSKTKQGRIKETC